VVKKVRSLIFVLLLVLPGTTLHAEGFLLIARDDSRDPNFAESVVLVTPYDQRGGSVGLILNRPLNIPIEKVLQIPSLQKNRHLLYFGGPVATNSVVFLFRHGKKLPRALHIVDDVYMSTHLPLLDELIKQGINGPTDLRVFLGYSGWARGQLASELKRGVWRLKRLEDSRLLLRKDVRGMWEELTGKMRGNWVMLEQNSENCSKSILSGESTEGRCAVGQNVPPCPILGHPFSS
jgi:putative transcriptional regulator